MTARRAGTGIALLSGAAILIAACGGNAATSTPSQPATPPPATEPAATNALPSFGLPDFSFALPSFSSDAELEGMFPSDIAGQPLTVQSMSGSDFLGFMGGANNPLGPALTQLGKTPEDLSVAFGGTADGSVTVFAFRIKGVNADTFLNAYTGVAGSQSGTTITDANLGGKAVKQVATGGTNVYLYLHGDVIWTVTSTNPATLNEAFTKLP